MTTGPGWHYDGPFGPSEVIEEWRNAARTARLAQDRWSAQAREAQRQQILAAAKNDVTAAFGAWAQQPDTLAARNLAAAVDAFLAVVDEPGL